VTLAEPEYSPTTVLFRWNGFGEGDEIYGEASAELNDDGSIDTELSFHHGDDANFITRRV